jgi:glyoxylase-like metal-dependent hydrolase (beta-lactamase superfamily II)
VVQSHLHADHAGGLRPGHSETGVRQYQDRADWTPAPTPELVLA